METRYDGENRVTNHVFEHQVRDDVLGTRVYLSEFSSGEYGPAFTSVSLHLSAMANEFSARLQEPGTVSVTLGDGNGKLFLSQEQARLLRRALGEVT